MPPIENTDPADVAVVGAGAAGLATAIFAAEALGERHARIVLLDGAKKIGAKILVSGGGRCNVTHKEVTPSDFNGHQVLVRNILAAFSVEQTIEWFRSIGVDLVEEETGKLFPVANTAGVVLDALIKRCEQLGISILRGERVQSLAAPSSADESFWLEHGHDLPLRARRVVLATGGRSLPRTGSDGAGWGLAQALGHSVTRTVPALVPLILDTSFFHPELSGIATEVTLTTRVDGKVEDQRTGSMLWTHFGISGPVAMDASRFYTGAVEAELPVSISCNLLPGHDAGGADRHLLRRCGAAPKASIKRILSATLPERLAAALCLHAGVDPRTPAGQLSRSARRTLVGALTDLRLPVIDDRGWNHAEVTAGGIPLDELDYRSMESRKTPGLFLVGEVLDCEGRIGGFNFQWAWSTGKVAGRAIGSSLTRDDD